MTLAVAPPVPIDAAAMARMIAYLDELRSEVERGNVVGLHVIAFGRGSSSMVFRGQVDGTTLLAWLSAAAHQENARMVAGFSDKPLTERGA